MLDDDLNFATRISENDTHLRSIQGEELIPEFERIEEKLSPKFPHVGFGQRQGNNNVATTSAADAGAIRLTVSSNARH
jgi:hypothetical protein